MIKSVYLRNSNDFFLLCARKIQIGIYYFIIRESFALRRKITGVFVCGCGCVFVYVCVCAGMCVCLCVGAGVGVCAFAWARVSVGMLVCQDVNWVNFSVSFREDCRKGMDENEYLHNTRAVSDRFRIYLRQKYPYIFVMHF